MSSSPLVSTLSFEAQSVTKPVAYQLARVTTHLPQESSYFSASLVLGSQSHTPGLYGSSGDRTIVLMLVWQALYYLSHLPGLCLL